MSKGGLDLKNARNTSLDILRIFAMFTVIFVTCLRNSIFFVAGCKYYMVGKA